MITIDLLRPTTAEHRVHGVGAGGHSHWIRLTSSGDLCSGNLDSVNLCTNSIEFCLRLELAVRECREALEREQQKQLGKAAE